ncbi:MAG: DNA translocase FtsK 4TM domain-containing protein [Leptospiraceae bacterium]|nr:DNA translocase FtsK 4TM domain-containing protein [Leptospiraceae bacterium]
MAKQKKVKTKKFQSEINTQINSSVPFLFISIGIFIFFSLISFEESNLGYLSNLFGRLGYVFSYSLFYLFGRGAYPLGIGTMLYGILMLIYKKKYYLHKIIITIFLFILSTSIFFSITDSNIDSLRYGGGALGIFTSNWLEFSLGKTGKMIFSICLFFYSAYRIVLEIPEKLSQFVIQKIIHAFKKKDSESTEREKFSPQNAIKERNGIKKSSVLSPWFEKESESGNGHKPVQAEFETDSDIKVYSTIEKISNEEFELINETGFYKGQFVDDSTFRFKESQNKNQDGFSTGNLTIVTETIGDDEEGLSQNKEEEPITTAEYLGLLTGSSYEPENEEEKPTVYMENLDDNQNGFNFDKIASSTTNNKPNTVYVSSFPGGWENMDYNINMDLLNVSRFKKDNYHFEDEARIVAKQIEKIIKDFGLDSRVESYQKGPSVTMYELKIPSGIRVNKFTTLDDELQLHLAAKSIRIIAPIPGKSAIGIEVPNKEREDVLLGDIYKVYKIQKNSSGLSIILGKDISGKVVTTDLNKLPHLLIAGTTGSGKSVAVNAMIASLIFSKSPEDVRFIMIDPKMVEMALYKEIPHLLMDVITDPRKATKALAWAIQEMEARYTVVSELKCRELSGYNAKVISNRSSKYKKMPYIVIFIDELSDLMMVAGKELEDYITRISQKARAVGIHLVMATQRPSVDVITGLIKANCPARIAFHVAQKMDSKIILDQSGADTLLGKGDLLYKSPTSSELRRIQAPYISEMEIENIVNEAKQLGKPNYVDVNLDEGLYQEDNNGEDENTFQEAWQIIKTERKASASYLQRRLRIGYNKAARIMELMEERGYVSPQIGSKPREILK